MLFWKNVRFSSFLAFIPNKALKEVWVRSILLTQSLDSFWPLRTHFSFKLFPSSNVAEQRGEQETQVNKEKFVFLKIGFWQREDSKTALRKGALQIRGWWLWAFAFTRKH